ncbi:MAG: hypothetical protein E7429_07155 [Ruminococcaceae bacterium]|nr:hypothetical protein [Oscillospiraceae bacterium]
MQIRNQPLTMAAVSIAIISVPGGLCPRNAPWIEKTALPRRPAALQPGELMTAEKRGGGFAATPLLHRYSVESALDDGGGIHRDHQRSGRALPAERAVD